MLRRVGKRSAPAVRQVGQLTLDPGRREIRLGQQGEAISLTPLESQLLDYLMLNAGHVLTNEAIIEHVWGPEGGDRDMLRQLVHRLRGKIARVVSPGTTDQVGSCSDQFSTRPPRIETIPGMGYGLNVDTDP